MNQLDILNDLLDFFSDFKNRDFRAFRINDKRALHRDVNMKPWESSYEYKLKRTRRAESGNVPSVESGCLPEDKYYIFQMKDIVRDFNKNNKAHKNEAFNIVKSKVVKWAACRNVKIRQVSEVTWEGEPSVAIIFRRSKDRLIFRLSWKSFADLE